MSSGQPTEESFLKDVEKHKMTVVRDDGVYRHLRFAATGQYSWNQWFEIVTWPGRLAYHGDMGTYVFSRIEDMFQFFRDGRQDGKLHINTSYWGEKLDAVSRHNGYKGYNEDIVRDQVKEHVDDWVEYNNINKKDARALREELDEEINYADGMHEAYRTINDFSHKIGEKAYWAQDTKKLVRSSRPDFNTFQFQDIFEWQWEDYTYHYVWCCYALAWSIKKYDSFKSSSEEVKDEMVA